MIIVDIIRNIEIINWKMMSDFLTLPPDEKLNPDFRSLTSLTFEIKTAGYRPAAKLTTMHRSMSSKRTNGLNNVLLEKLLSGKDVKKW
jgi:hypothetical protein